MSSLHLKSGSKRIVEESYKEIKKWRGVGELYRRRTKDYEEIGITE